LHLAGLRARIDSGERIKHHTHTYQGMKHRRPRAAQNKDVIPLIADQVFQPAVVHAPRKPAPKRKSLNKKAPKRAKAKTVVKRARGSGNRGGSKKGGGRKSGRR
jgi:hypothetical protein